MQNFTAILNEMLSALEKLTELLQEENRLLSSLQIESLKLHILTDKKQQLLITLAHHDNARIQHEALIGVLAPYDQYAEWTQPWQQICELTKTARQLNQKNGFLLDKQQKHVVKMQQALQSTSLGQMVYGADGHAQQGAKRSVLQQEI